MISGDDIAQTRFAERYQIRRSLSRSDTSEVFLAFDKQLKQGVVLKRIFNSANTEDFLRQCQERLEIHSRLGSRHVIALYDSFAEGDSYYLALELMDNSVGQYSEPLEVNRVTRWAENCLTGLGEIHAHDILHLDIKPSNIFIDWDGNARLGDFGIAHNGVSSNLAAWSSQYIPPEVILGDIENTGPCSDLYSLGMVMYQMLLGDQGIRTAFLEVFEVDNSPKIVNNRWLLWHCSPDRAAPRLSEYRDGVSDALSDWLSQMVAKKPQQRFPTASDALAALEETSKSDSLINIEPAPSALIIRGKKKVERTNEAAEATTVVRVESNARQVPVEPETTVAEEELPTETEAAESTETTEETLEETETHEEPDEPVRLEDKVGPDRIDESEEQKDLAASEPSAGIEDGQEDVAENGLPESESAEKKPVNSMSPSPMMFIESILKTEPGEEDSPETDEEEEDVPDESDSVGDSNETDIEDSVGDVALEAPQSVSNEEEQKDTVVEPPPEKPPAPPASEPIDKCQPPPNGNGRKKKSVLIKFGAGLGILLVVFIILWITNPFELMLGHAGAEKGESENAESAEVTKADNVGNETQFALTQEDLTGHDNAGQQVEITTEPAEPGAEDRIDIPQTVTNSVGMQMRLMEPGTFKMGSYRGAGDEGPVHEVTITKPYYIAVYEVTQAQFERVMGWNPAHFRGDIRPVENVSWQDAHAFCRELSRLEGVTYRLPTEAEWEFAARGGSASWGYPYSGAINYDDVAWHEGNSGGFPHYVGSKQPNELGLYDMSGNVWEWCLSWYGGYPSSVKVDPIGPYRGEYRVLRGGSWVSDATDTKSTGRFFAKPSAKLNCYGFRVVREL